MVLVRLRQGRSTTSVLKNIVQQQISASHEYAKRMQKIGKMLESFDSKMESRMMNDAIKTLAMLHGEMAQNAMTYAQSMQKQVLIPMEDMLRGLEQVKHENKRNVLKHAGRMQECATDVERAQKKYKQRCQDAIDIESDKKNAGLSLEKRTAKYEKLKTAVKTSEDEYRDAVTRLHTAHLNWKVQMQLSLDDLQKLEGGRIHATRNLLMLTNTCWQARNQKENAVLCLVDNAIQRIDVDSEISEFVSSHGTGNSVPEPGDFEPFGVAMEHHWDGSRSADSATLQKDIPSEDSLLSGIRRVSLASPADKQATVSSEKHSASIAERNGSKRDMLFTVQAVFDYSAFDENELSFEHADLIDILDTDQDPWWYGRSHRTGECGMVPSNFVEKQKM